jgi:hypothetical protein
MRQQPMIADIDSQDAENEKARNEENDPCPTEKPWKKRQAGSQMNEKKAVDIVLFPLHRTPYPQSNHAPVLLAHATLLLLGIAEPPKAASLPCGRILAPRQEPVRAQ